MTVHLFKFLFEDWTGDPIYSHGSYIYLMGPDGKFQTLMPPILLPDRMAEIIRGYLQGLQNDPRTCAQTNRIRHHEQRR